MVGSVNLYFCNFRFPQCKCYYDFMLLKTMLYFNSDVQLRDFHIAVGDNIDSCYSFKPENFTHCVHVPGRPVDLDAQPFSCDEPVKGRYVAVYLEGRRSLILCEVEVQGTSVTGSVSSLVNDSLIWAVTPGFYWPIVLPFMCNNVLTHSFLDTHLRVL